ncbi:MAG: 23S rRNA pseudouridine(1911/1915/1917) synthase RluD [Coxiella endosymbiont of Haemaphysalis qinghaiensis]
MHSKRIFLKNIIPTELEGVRLDQALAKLFPNYSRSQLQNWIRTGHVRVDGTKKMLIREKARANQLIEITAHLELSERWVAQALPLNIVYEDKALLIINKPPRLAVHPGAGVPDRTLINALLHHDPQLATLPRSGIIHRLDKDTSGLLVVARNLISYYTLTKAMKARKITREYEAFVKGVLISGRTINTPIGRHPIHRTRMAIVNNGRKAITHFRVLQRYRAHTYIRIQLETGRTHQIRLHMAHIHHPLVGDPVYGNHIGIPTFLSDSLKVTLKVFHRQALHAVTLQLSHPLTQQTMEWHTPLPKDMLDLLKSLAKDNTHTH